MGKFVNQILTGIKWVTMGAVKRRWVCTGAGFVVGVVVGVIVG